MANRLRDRRVDIAAGGYEEASASVTPCLADSPLGTADDPRRLCFTCFVTEDRRSPPRAGYRAFLATPYAALKASTSSSSTRAHSLTLSLSVHSPSRRHGRRLSALLIRRPILRAPLHGFQIHRTQSSTTSLAPSSTSPTTATTPTSPGISDSPAVGLSLVQTRPHRGTPSSEHRFLRPRAQIDCK